MLKSNFILIFLFNKLKIIKLILNEKYQIFLQQFIFLLIKFYY